MMPTSNGASMLDMVFRIGWMTSSGHGTETR